MTQTAALLALNVCSHTQAHCSHRLSKYEISMVECMHDIGNHIDNLIEELPHHLIKEADKLLIKNMITAYNSDKEQKHCCDRRKFLLQMTQYLHLKIDSQLSEPFLDDLKVTNVMTHCAKNLLIVKKNSAKSKSIKKHTN